MLYFQTTDPNINQQSMSQQHQQMSNQQQQGTNQKPSTPIQQQQPQTPTQTASKTRKRKSQTYADTQKKKIKKVRSRIPGRRTLTSQEETQSTPTTPQQMPQRQTPTPPGVQDNTTISSMAEHINMNSKRIPSQQDQETYINSLLSNNCLIIAKIRENLLKGDINNNLELIGQFRNNIIQVLTW